MDLIHDFWGVKDDISPLDIAARSAVMFILTLLMIRISGMRSFRKNNSFDMVIFFLIGGVLSRGVVGATPFISTLAAGLVLIVLHRIFARLSFYSTVFEKATKGERVLIYKDGKFIKKNMKKVDVTTLEVYEDLRVDFQCESLEGFAEVYVEKTGEISFIRK
jgi:uncharacterized membrane protein YcaP (DUF421 family)